MFVMGVCPRCGVILPGNSEELDERLWSAANWIGTTILDEWYCPDCSYSFIQDWRLNEVCWHDAELIAQWRAENKDPNDKSPSTFFICCGEWHQGTCFCDRSYSWEDGLETLGFLKLDPDDLYELREDNLDCSTCDHYIDKTCAPFVHYLGSFMLRGGEDPQIQPCADWQYNASQEQHYKYGRLTRDMMITEVELRKLTT